MPVVLVSTDFESGQTNLGPYSLCFPYIIANESEWAMMLVTRRDSNTSTNIKRTKKCTLNFIPDEKKYMENCVMLGFPGETTEEKMPNSIFTLIPSPREGTLGNPYPEIVKEAFQVFECHWDVSFDHELIDGCDNFVLRVDNILLDERYHSAICRGMEAKHFPPVPIDYGFRDNYQFWFAETKKPYAVPIPSGKGVDVGQVIFAAKRIDPSYEWTEEAAVKITAVPRVFLKRVISGVHDAAAKEGITTISPEFMDKVRDKRNEANEN